MQIKVYFVFNTLSQAKSQWLSLASPFEDVYIPAVHPTNPPASSVVYGNKSRFSATKIFLLFSTTHISAN